MAELHWHAATSAGSADGIALIGQGSVHLAADLPAGVLQNAVATLPWPMDDDERLCASVRIGVYHGYALPDLAAKVREAIANAVASQVGMQVGSVDVYIDGIQFAG